MTRTVTAFFDSRADAETAKASLSRSGVDAERARIVDRDTPGEGINSTVAGGPDQSLFESLTRMFMPGEDAAAYHEGIMRGGFLLTAEVPEEQADEAIRILDDAECVDMEERMATWRSEGWAPEAEGGASGMRDPHRGHARVRAYARNTMRG